MGLDFGEVSESELGGHSFKHPLEALKLNESSLVGDQLEAEVGFFARLDNQALVLLIFDSLKVFVPVLDQHLKVGDLDVLHEGVVKSETDFNGLFEVADSRVAVDYEGRESVAIHTVDELLFFTVSAIEQLENLLHRSLVVPLSVNLRVLVEVLGHLRPRHARAVCLCDLLLAAQPDVRLGHLRDDQVLVVRDF